jgi:hypothetical protein
VAGAKGLEPSTSAVTGQRSNQLSYAPAGDETDLRRAPSQVKNSDAAPSFPGPFLAAVGAAAGDGLDPVPAVVFRPKMAGPRSVVPRRLVGGDGLEPPTSSV